MWSSDTMAEHIILASCVFGLGRVQKIMKVEKESRLCQNYEKEGFMPGPDRCRDITITQKDSLCK